MCNQIHFSLEKKIEFSYFSQKKKIENKYATIFSIFCGIPGKVIDL